MHVAFRAGTSFCLFWHVEGLQCCKLITHIIPVIPFVRGYLALAPQALAPQTYQGKLPGALAGLDWRKKN